MTRPTDPDLSPDTMRAGAPTEPLPVVPRPPPDRRRIGAVVAGAGVLAAVVAAVILGGETSAPAAPAAPAVPRVEEGAIVLPEGFHQRAGLKIEPASRVALAPVVRVVGTASFDPAHVAAAGTRLRGLVRKLHKIEGDAVRAGDVLAEIESAELGEAQASVAMVRAHRKAAERNAERERDLAAKKLTTARELELAEAGLAEQRALLAAAEQRVAALGGGAGGPFGVYLLRAPIDGTVVDRQVSAGQSVDEHLVAFRVANLDHLWVELSVFEQRLRDVRRGDAVTIRPLGEPDTRIEGQVAHVGERVDLDTRSAAVRVHIDNRARRLRPGQSVAAEIRSAAPSAPQLAVPHEAITFVDGRPTVFVALAHDRVAPRPVELGTADGSLQAITRGLAEGERVVTAGVFALKSELFR